MSDLSLFSTVVSGDVEFHVPQTDTGLGRILLERGEFAPAKLDFMLAACPGDLMDVGANIGALCLPFAAARPHANVIALEAQRAVAEVLGANCSHNQLPNIGAFHAIAGEQAAKVQAPQLDLTVEQNLAAASLYEPHAAMTEVQMIPIDGLAKPSLALVKIDVAGFESRVLQGAGRLLAKARPNWLVSAPARRPKERQAVKEVLAGHGYRLFWFFSPYTRGGSGQIAGDHLLFASDYAPPWDLPPADGDPPTNAHAYGYLKGYGF
jgi:FkbM family methyltransferase